jgi:transitional endoplasmic reticulum ATPase
VYPDVLGMSPSDNRRVFVMLKLLLTGGNFLSHLLVGLFACPDLGIYDVHARGIGIVNLHRRSEHGRSIMGYQINGTQIAWVLCLLAIVYLSWVDPAFASLGMAIKKPIAPPEIKWSGSEITLPESPSKMSLDDGIAWLTKIRNDQESEIAVVEEVPGYDPYDVAHALKVTIARIYGFAQGAPWGNATVNVKTDIDTTVQVPWGRFRLPNVSGILATTVRPYSNPPLFVLQVSDIKKKDAHLIKSLMDAVRAELKTGSIYQGKVVKFTWDADEEKQGPIEFVDVRSADPDKLIFSADIAEQVQTTVYTPLLKQDLCKSLNVPFKRGVCLMGPYGTGKTLAMYVAAKYAMQHGVTSVIVEDARYLSHAMRFARQYAPALVICEDIDRVTRERDDTCDDIMDALDGAEAKDKEVMVLFTSNDGESIHEAMRRPGRIDTFIKVLPPDAHAVDRLLRMYGKGRIATGEDLSEVCLMLQGQIPAVIREVVERAKLAAIARATTVEDASELWAEDLAVSARRMLMQIDLFTTKKNGAIGESMAIAAQTLMAQGSTLAKFATAEMHTRTLQGSTLN